MVKAELTAGQDGPNGKLRPSLSLSRCLLLLIAPLSLPFFILPTPFVRPIAGVVLLAVLCFGFVRHFIPYWDERMKTKGVTGRDLHKPPPVPVLSEGMGLVSALVFVLAAVASQVLLKNDDKKAALLFFFPTGFSPFSTRSLASQLWLASLYPFGSIR